MDCKAELVLLGKPWMPNDALGAMIEGQTPNTVDLANLLPLKTEQQDVAPRNG